MSDRATTWRNRDLAGLPEDDLTTLGMLLVAERSGERPEPPL